MARYQDTRGHDFRAQGHTEKWLRCMVPSPQRRLWTLEQ